ncbi:hypothetical protein [Mitsuokella jalaludinii]|uniref:hypothetical protein n=1 Tax=Mitsuokella jalaludinii TaxID=187979 RepID=UPI003F9D4847
MEYKTLYYTLKDIFPDYAEEILKGLFLINDGLKKTKDSIGNIPYKVLKEDNNLNKITDMEDSINNLLRLISNMNIDIAICQNNQDRYKNIKEKLIDINMVNQPINGKMFQKMNFTGRKPIKFELFGEEKDVTSWKDLFFFVCESLSVSDIKKFNEFVHNSEFKGRTRWYFSYDEKQLSTPELIHNTNIYAEKNLPANTIRDILSKMFKKYRIGESDFQVYLKSGYKSKRAINEDENDRLTKYIVETMKPSDRKKKIGLNQQENRKLDEFMGTKSHIGYIKMKEDHKRTKNRCIYYDKDLSCCLCKKSPYLHTHCGNISHCDFYEETNVQDEKYNSKTNSIREILANDIIYVFHDIKNDDEVTCPHCHGKLRPRILSLLDKTDNKRVSLNGYECIKCHNQFSPYQDVKTLQMAIGLHSLGSKIY